MINTKNKILKHSLNIVLILIGTFIMGSAFNIFYSHSNILLGGFGGLATIICYLLSFVGIYIPMSAIYLIMNVILYIFAVKTLGRTFALYAVIGILSYSLFLEICKFPAVSSDLLLCSIYGGVLSGIGVGIIIRCGGSTGGGDMLGCIITHKNPRISVGWITIIVNIIVITIGIFVYGLNLTLYAIIGIFIAGKTSDFIIEGPKSVKAFYIVTPKSDELAKRFMAEIHRGVTSFDAYGKYSGNHIEMLLCLVNGHQVPMLKQIVYDTDKDAFMFAVNVKEAMGKGFHKLEKHKSFASKKHRNLKLTNIENISLSSTPQKIEQIKNNNKK